MTRLIAGFLAAAALPTAVLAASLVPPAAWHPAVVDVPLPGPAAQP